MSFHLIPGSLYITCFDLIHIHLVPYFPRQCFCHQENITGQHQNPSFHQIYWWYYQRKAHKHKYRNWLTKLLPYRLTSYRYMLSIFHQHSSQPVRCHQKVSVEPGKVRWLICLCHSKLYCHHSRHKKHDYRFQPNDPSDDTSDRPLIYRLHPEGLYKVQ